MTERETCMVHILFPLHLLLKRCGLFAFFVCLVGFLSFLPHFWSSSLLKKQDSSLHCKESQPIKSRKPRAAQAGEHLEEEQAGSTWFAITPSFPSQTSPSNLPHVSSWPHVHVETHWGWLSSYTRFYLTFFDRIARADSPSKKRTLQPSATLWNFSVSSSSALQICQTLESC